MVKRKGFLIILAIIGLSALVFSQCFSPGSAGKDQAKQDPKGPDMEKIGSASNGAGTRISVQVAMGAEDFQQFSKMAAAFSEARDGIELDVKNVDPKEAYSLWKKASQMGEAPDMMLLDNSSVHEFAALGFLQPVDEFFSSDRQNGRIELLMNQVKWNGYIWGVPKDADPYILAWNKKTAAEAGFNKAPETPEDLLVWNSLLLNPKEGTFGIYSNPEDPYSFIALASSLTGGWLTDGKVWSNPDEAKKSLEAFFAPQDKEWNAKTYSSNFPKEKQGSSAWDRLLQGKLGAIVTTVSAFKKNATPDIAMAALPAYTGSEHTVWFKGRSFVISSRSTHVDVLIDWLKDLTLPQNEVKSWEATKKLPTQIPSFQLPPLQVDEHIQSYDWMIRQGKVLPASADAPKKIGALSANLRKLWMGEEDIVAFVDEIMKSWGPEESLPDIK